MNLLRSVRGRITLVSTGLVALTLIVVSLVIVELVEADLRDTTEEALAAALEAQAEQFEADFFDVATEQVFLFDIDGRPLELGLFTFPGEGLAQGLLIDGDVPVAELLIDMETEEVIEVYEPFGLEPLDDPFLVGEVEELIFDTVVVPGDDGDVLLVGATALDEIERSVAAVRRALMVIVPLLVAGFGLLTWFLVGRALRPVHAITERVDEISSTSLDQRVPVPDGGDEITDLAHVMNGMLGRLQRGDRRLREFSADASHELRSPLASVRAAAEMIERDPTAHRNDRLAADIVAETDRMTDLVSDLLALSASDAGSTEAVERGPLDLADLVRAEIGSDVGSTPSGGGHADGDSDVTVVVDGPTTVVGSPDQLRRVVRNLVDNARRHRRTRIEVSVIGGGGEVDLHVDDDGDGIPEQDRERVFDRFTRLDEARTRDRGGSGLGLALVKAIVEDHGGRVNVDSSPTLGGARITARLPLH